MRFKSSVVIFFLSVFCVNAVHAAKPVSPGGSVLAWYNLDANIIPAPYTGDLCGRDEYPILRDYQSGNTRSIVYNQLQVMRSNGQQRVRIAFFHKRGASRGVSLNSYHNNSQGNFSNHDKESLRQFLSDIKAAGFNDILFGFYPQQANNPTKWYAWNEDLYKENWLTIYRIRKIIKQSGLRYKIDLSNEAAAAPSNAILIRYTRRMWNDYNRVFGKNDTVGFSLATNSKSNDPQLGVNRYRTMKSMYNNSKYGSPYLWELHIYENFKNIYEAIDKEMVRQGDNATIVIGETFYDDYKTWRELLNSKTHRKIWHVHQWPVSRKKGCDTNVDVIPTSRYRYYAR